MYFLHAFIYLFYYILLGCFLASLTLTTSHACSNAPKISFCMAPSMSVAVSSMLTKASFYIPPVLTYMEQVVYIYIYIYILYIYIYIYNIYIYIYIQICHRWSNPATSRNRGKYIGGRVLDDDQARHSEMQDLELGSLSNGKPVSIDHPSSGF